MQPHAEIICENNARHLLKRVQNHENLVNNMVISMPDYFINTFFIKRIPPNLCSDSGE